MKLREQAEATCNQISSIINASPYESAKKEMVDAIEKMWSTRRWKLRENARAWQWITARATMIRPTKSLSVWHQRPWDILRGFRKGRSLVRRNNQREWRWDINPWAQKTCWVSRVWYPPQDGINLPGDSFTLLDYRHQIISMHDYGGSFILIFFGYTNCPEICPTGFNNIAVTLDKLGVLERQF